MKTQSLFVAQTKTRGPNVVASNAYTRHSGRKHVVVTAVIGGQNKATPQPFRTPYQESRNRKLTIVENDSFAPANESKTSYIFPASAKTPAQKA